MTEEFPVLLCRMLVVVREGTWSFCDFGEDCGVTGR